ncbi:lambda exonuclease family protein [Psittacicella hinzii]|uniref:YqaJ viral recombinase domain-containing protein n=1 Tax=Psittacicella hinzii TaxID=2028575 RepID=A0A3A1YJQ8_9GAMM|nr:lambda exonuclease family protein [Psittacicella hinzii]RIY37479.1 hypothetical protein CKF58_04985 [Psittacicella hinzii]
MHNPESIFYEIDVPQRSPEWLQARLTRFTASQAKTFTRLKSGKLSKTAIDTAQKIALSLTARSFAAYEMKDASDNASFNIQLGVVGEPYARDIYQALHPEYRVKEVGLLVKKSNDLIAASPDGLVEVLNPETGEYCLEGLVEIKTPTRDTHLNHLCHGVIPEDYYAQILHQLLVTGCKWADFITYYPDIDYKDSFAVTRVYADPKQLKEYEDLLEELCKITYETMTQLNKNVQRVNERRYLSNLNMDITQVDKILKAAKKEFILYSNLGQFITNRNGYENDEAVSLIPTPQEVQEQDKVIVEEYLENHPELKGKGRRSLVWEAKREYRLKQQDQLDEANQSFIDQL